MPNIQYNAIIRTDHLIKSETPDLLYCTQLPLKTHIHFLTLPYCTMHLKAINQYIQPIALKKQTHHNAAVYSLIVYQFTVKDESSKKHTDPSSHRLLFC